MNYFINDWYSDCCILESFLSEIEFYSGTDRKTKQFKGVKVPKGGGSMLYGTTWKGFLKYDKDGNKIYREKDINTNMYLTKCKSKYHYLNNVFKKFYNL